VRQRAVQFVDGAIAMARQVRKDMRFTLIQTEFRKPCEIQPYLVCGAMKAGNEAQGGHQDFGSIRSMPSQNAKGKPSASPGLKEQGADRARTNRSAPLRKRGVRKNKTPRVI
jgi:hypothetical protein